MEPFNSVPKSRNGMQNHLELFDVSEESPFQQTLSRVHLWKLISTSVNHQNITCVSDVRYWEVWMKDICLSPSNSVSEELKAFGCKISIKREWIYTYPMNITTPTFAISSCRICHVFVTNSFCSLVKGGLSTVGLISSIALPCTSILQPSGLLSPPLYVLDFLLVVLSWEVWLPMVVVWYYSSPWESTRYQKCGTVQFYALFLCNQTSLFFCCILIVCFNKQNLW